MRHIFKKSGFTMAELLIYIAVLTLVTVMVANSFIILNKGRGGVEAKSELNSNLRFVVEKMKRDISTASAIASPATTLATSSLLELTVGTDIIKYSINASRISRQINTNPIEYISSTNVKINSLYFSKLENINSVLSKKKVSVEINLAASYNSNSPDYQYQQSLQTSVDLNQDF